jgi:hypothetical protein
MQPNNRSWKALALLALALGAGAVRWEAEQGEAGLSMSAACSIVTDADDCSLAPSTWIANR